MSQPEVFEYSVNDREIYFEPTSLPAVRHARQSLVAHGVLPIEDGYYHGRMHSLDLDNICKSTVVSSIPIIGEPTPEPLPQPVPLPTSGVLFFRDDTLTPGTAIIYGRGRYPRYMTADVLQSWAKGSTLLACSRDNTASFKLGELADKINEFFGV
jgi:hypothetical protein